MQPLQALPPAPRMERADCLALAGRADTETLMQQAAALRDAGCGDVVSYSKKVFIPLTQLCRDVCHYCTFAHAPRRGKPAYLSLDEVVRIAERGAAAGCTEALFTLGDQPERRYAAARDALAELGHPSTLSLLATMSAAVFSRTGLLPHLNPGLMGAADFAALRPFAASMGIMLETAAARLSEKDGPHYGSPDKLPAARLETIRLAGEAAVPFTSGLLIGIGETRLERIEAMLALRDLHDRYGHIQEIIVQNFRAKPGTRMAATPEPDLDDHLWTLAVARLVFGPDMNIQAPPNLAKGALPRLIAAGINDWGGVSPVTCDHVNPEAPWPELQVLAEATETAGKVLVQRMPVYPAYVAASDHWLDAAIAPAIRARMDAAGYVREGAWAPGQTTVPLPARGRGGRTASISKVLVQLQAGDEIGEAAIATLFSARGEDLEAVCRQADALRRRTVGDTVSYVVTRNINYTNICSFKCQFCAFSKGRTHAHLRGPAYELSPDEIQRRVAEAWARGATEVCMQGGIHPGYTGQTYLDICALVKQAAPQMHIHAFSPLEVWEGARTLGIAVPAFLDRLRRAGLGSLPGTAAEILDDEVRAVLCPDKINTRQWLEVIGAAHRAGLRTTSTIMFGHVDRPVHWARHLLHLRNLQVGTGGFTEFVPLPFVHMEAPIALKGRARPGPSWRETLLMHAVARLVLHPLIPNIQLSWVKLGQEAAGRILQAGANDLGGTLMNETISRAAGAAHGQEMSPGLMQAMIARLGRTARQRTTLYADAPAERRWAAETAAPLAELPANAPVRLRRTDREILLGA